MKMICGLVFLACAVHCFPHRKLIAGGQAASVSEFPFMASLQYNIIDRGERINEHICGASILDQYHLLTAAHCVYGESARDLMARTGNDNRQQGRGVAVSRIVMHPQYTQRAGAPNEDAYDIAIIKLASPLKIDATTQPVCLVDHQPIAPHTPLTIVGWGSVNSRDEIGTTMLKKVSMTTGTDLRCARALEERRMDRKLLCIQPIVGKGVCSGDSGGPSLMRVDGVNGKTWAQAGVTSFGLERCELHSWEFHTRVSEYLPWIARTANIPTARLSCASAPSASPAATNTAKTTTTAFVKIPATTPIGQSSSSIATPTITTSSSSSPKPAYFQPQSPTFTTSTQRQPFTATSQPYSEFQPSTSRFSSSSSFSSPIAQPQQPPSGSRTSLTPASSSSYSSGDSFPSYPSISSSLGRHSSYYSPYNPYSSSSSSSSSYDSYGSYGSYAWDDAQYEDLYEELYDEYLLDYYYDYDLDGIGYYGY